MNSKSPAYSSDSEVIKKTRIRSKRPNHDDPLFQESYKAIRKHKKLLVNLKECSCIEENVKESFFKKGVILCKVHRGFSDGLRYYTSYFTDQSSGEWAQEKRETWKRYIKETNQKSQEIIDLLKAVQKEV